MSAKVTLGSARTFVTIAYLVLFEMMERPIHTLSWSPSVDPLWSSIGRDVRCGAGRWRLTWDYPR
jgi:hypothetical protein